MKTNFSKVSAIVFESLVMGGIGAFIGREISSYFNSGRELSIIKFCSLFYAALPILDYGMKLLDDYSYVGDNNSYPDDL